MPVSDIPLIFSGGGGGGGGIGATIDPAGVAGLEASSQPTLPPNAALSQQSALLEGLRMEILSAIRVGAELGSFSAGRY
jgi:hypothetical protein